MPDAPAPPPPRRRRSFARRVLFAAVAIALIALVCEGLAFGAWWFLTGERFGWWRAQQRRGEALAAAPGAQTANAAQLALNAGLQPHPFLGYVCSPNSLKAFSAGSVHGPINAFGFIDDRPPLRKRAPDRYIVAITGGSVAAQTSVVAWDVLSAELRRSPRLQGREPELVRLALGGFRQPQQLFALEYMLMLGGEFDCVINIDGFNEVALASGNLRIDVPEFFPRDWAPMVEARATPEYLQLAGKLALLREQRHSAAQDAGRLWWSALAQVAWLVGDRRQTLLIADAVQAVAEHRQAGTSRAGRGPGASPSLPEALERMALVWMQCSKSLDAVCRAHGAAYYHFLQPNQYVPGSKPIGAGEAKVAVAAKHQYREGVELGYPLLEQRIPELTAAGVRFTDLRWLLRDHPEPLYVDTCCHLNEAGYEILARRAAAVIRRHLDLEGAVFRSLAVEPAELRLADPRTPLPFRVVATLADGSTHDVTDPAFETSISFDGADVAAVGPHGLEARRRGTTTLRARLHGQEATARVVADWPARLGGTDHPGDANGIAPHIAIVDGPGPDGTVHVQCANVPPGTFGVLGVALRPLPAAAYRDPTEFLGTQLHAVAAGTDGAPAIVAVKTAAVRDVPHFLRAYFVGKNGKIAAASNSLVVTPD
jgi:hypothetical protein